MVIKATNAAPQFWEEFQSRFGRLNLSFSTIKLLTAFLLNLLAASAVLLCLDWGILVINKELSIGQVFSNSLQVNVVGLIGLVIGN